MATDRSYKTRSLLQRELHRSLYHEKKLRLLTDTLLSQRARQCVISLLEHQEQERLRRLLAILSEFASTCERWRAERDREVSSLSRLSAFVAEKNRSAVLPRSDLLLNSLLKLLHDKGNRPLHPQCLLFLFFAFKLKCSTAGCLFLSYFLTT